MEISIFYFSVGVVLGAIVNFGSVFIFYITERQAKVAVKIEKALEFMFKGEMDKAIVAIESVRPWWIFKFMGGDRLAAAQVPNGQRYHYASLAKIARAKGNNAEADRLTQIAERYRIMRDSICCSTSCCGGSARVRK